MVAQDVEVQPAAQLALSGELTADQIERGQRLASALFKFGKQQGTVAARMSKSGVDRSAVILLKTLVLLGPSRSGALAEAVHSDPSTISRQVAALVKEGLIERRADPEDGRASLLAATDDGIALLAEHRDRFGMAMARMLRHWEPDELERFIGLLERFLADHEQYMPTLISDCLPGAGQQRNQGER